MRSVRVLLVLCAAALAWGGCDDSVAPTARYVDGAAPPRDAAPTDAIVAPDVGPPPGDAGARDTGLPPADTGTRDTGLPMVDAGPSSLPPGLTTRTVMAGGVERTLVLYVPPTFRAGLAGVVALHGNGDTAQNFLEWSGLRSTADAGGFAVIAPQALSGHYMGSIDWDAYTRPESENIDIQVTIAARTELTNGGASPQRIYLVGHSQGGFLAYHVAMARSTDFAAVHVASAASPLGGGLATIATRKIPVDLLIGQLDGLLMPAQETRDELTALGFPHRYTEVPGEGHCCPIMGRVPDIWTWLSMHTL